MIWGSSDTNEKETFLHSDFPVSWHQFVGYPTSIYGFVTLDTILWGGWPQLCWPRPTGVLRFPSPFDSFFSTNSDCISSDPQGVPLIMQSFAHEQVLCDNKHTETGRERNQSEGVHFAQRSMVARWLRRSRCPVLINMVMSLVMTSHRKERGRPHRKWNLIEVH